MIEFEPPLYVRLPEVERDGKRVLRQVGIHPWRGADMFDAEYMERPTNQTFQTIGPRHVCETFEECLRWGDSCGK